MGADEGRQVGLRTEPVKWVCSDLRGHTSPSPGLTSRPVKFGNLITFGGRSALKARSWQPLRPCLIQFCSDGSENQFSASMRLKVVQQRRNLSAASKGSLGSWTQDLRKAETWRHERDLQGTGRLQLIQDLLMSISFQFIPAEDGCALRILAFMTE